MTLYEWKVQVSDSCSVHETGCLDGLQYILENQRSRIESTETMDWLTRIWQVDKEQIFLIPCLYLSRIKNLAQNAGRLF